MDATHETLRIRRRSILSIWIFILFAATSLALPGPVRSNGFQIRLIEDLSGKALHAVLHTGEPVTVAGLLDHHADAKEVVNKLVAENFEGIRKNFNAQMKAGLSADKMKEVWTAVVSQIGKYKSQGQPHSGPGPGGYNVVVIRCQMEKGEIDVEVDYDSDGLIGGLWVRPLP